MFAFGILLPDKEGRYEFLFLLVHPDELFKNIYERCMHEAKCYTL